MLKLLQIYSQFSTGIIFCKIEHCANDITWKSFILTSKGYTQLVEIISEWSIYIYNRQKSVIICITSYIVFMLYLTFFSKKNFKWQHSLHKTHNNDHYREFWWHSCCNLTFFFKKCQKLVKFHQNSFLVFEVYND